MLILSLACQYVFDGWVVEFGHCVASGIQACTHPACLLAHIGFLHKQCAHAYVNGYERYNFAWRRVQRTGLSAVATECGN